MSGSEPGRTGKGDAVDRVIGRLKAVMQVAEMADAAVRMPPGSRAQKRAMARTERMLALLKRTPL